MKYFLNILRWFGYNKCKHVNIDQMWLVQGVMCRRCTDCNEIEVEDISNGFTKIVNSEYKKERKLGL